MSANSMRRAFTTGSPAVILNEAPSAATAQKAQSCKIYARDGAQTTLGTVLKESSKSKVLVVFIRHFFCGNCQEYIRRITASIPPSSLPSDLQIIIIGCGAASLIESYIALAGDCPYSIYADPGRNKLYKLLGMHRSLSLGSRSPDYIQHSLIAGCWKSVVQGIKRIGSGDVMQAGDLSVNGGEFLFWRDGPIGPKVSGEWKVGWCHRMRNSRDHTEVEELKRHIGLGGEGAEEKPVPVRRATTSRLQKKLSQRSQSFVGALRRTSSSKPEPKEKVQQNMPELESVEDERSNDGVKESNV